MGKKKRLETLVVEAVNTAAIKSVGNFQSLVAKLVSLITANGYYIEKQWDELDNSRIKFRKSPNGREAFIIMDTSKAAEEDGFYAGLQCDAADLCVIINGLAAAERRWYYRGDGKPVYMALLSGTGPMWDNAGDAITAIKKARERKKNALKKSVYAEEQTVKTLYKDDALHLHTSNARTILTLLRHYDSYRDVKPDDIISVEFCHTYAQGYAEMEIRVKVRKHKTWVKTYEHYETALRYEKRKYRGLMIRTHGEDIPAHMCGTAEPWTLAIAVAGIRTNSIGVRHKRLAGYFMAASDPVYGFTYAVTDVSGRLLRNGYSAAMNDCTRHWMEQFLKDISRTYRLFKYKEVQFAEPEWSPTPFSHLSLYSVPLCMKTAVTTKPFGNVYESAQCARDLSAVTAEEWDDERGFTWDGNDVFICGGRHADEYCFHIEQLKDGVLMLRSSDGKTKIAVHKDDRTIARAYAMSESSGMQPVALTTRNKNDLRKIIYTLES